MKKHIHKPTYAKVLLHLINHQAIRCSTCGSFIDIKNTEQKSSFYITGIAWLLVLTSMYDWLFNFSYLIRTFILLFVMVTLNYCVIVPITAFKMFRFGWWEEVEIPIEDDVPCDHKPHLGLNCQWVCKTCGKKLRPANRLYRWFDSIVVVSCMIITVPLFEKVKIPDASILTFILSVLVFVFFCYSVMWILQTLFFRNSKFILDN